MKEFGTGAVRDIGGKGRMDLLPWCAIRRLSVHMEKGNEGHGERNWEKGIPMHCFLDSAFRHLSKYMDGYTDEDHLCAAAWNVLCAMWTEENLPEMMDIPTRKSKSVNINSKPKYVCKYYQEDEDEDFRCWAHETRSSCPFDGDDSRCNIPTY